YNRGPRHRADGARRRHGTPQSRDAQRGARASRRRLGGERRQGTGHGEHPGGGVRGPPDGGIGEVAAVFGTDGIRGVANEPPLTPELVYRVGRQLVATLQAERGVERVRLVIGRDTRRSGPLLESALVAGILSAGGDCYAVDVMPTPAIALLTRAL